MDYSLLIEYLRQKRCLTALEKDIMDTWNELQKSPFDMNSAENQVRSNDDQYPEIAIAVAALPTTVQKLREQITETDLKYRLTLQFTALAAKKGWVDQRSINWR